MPQEEKQLSYATLKVLEMIDKSGIPVKEFERLIGVKESVIRQTKTYKRNNLSADTIYKCAKFFSVTTDYLFGLADMPNSPTSWFIFKYKIFDKGDRTLEEVASAISQPISIFTDWELGIEPDQRTLWAICNLYQLKTNPFVEIKKAVPMERPESDLTTIENIKGLLAENNGIDIVSKLYKELQEKQQLFVLTWLVGYMMSEGLPVNKILGK